MMCDKHCWHVYYEDSDNFTNAGKTMERCCWCGKDRTRRFTLEQDPKHGKFQGYSTLRVYRDA